jgi:excisionase family DNA binding protein
MGVSTQIPGDGPLVPLKYVNAPLGIGLSTSYAMLREGRYPLPTVRVGRHYKVRRDLLEAFLSGQPAVEPTERRRTSREGRRADLSDLFPDLDEDVRRVAEELVARAPELRREQLDRIRAVLDAGDPR